MLDILYNLSNGVNFIVSVPADEIRSACLGIDLGTNPYDKSRIQAYQEANSVKQLMVPVGMHKLENLHQFERLVYLVLLVK